MYRFLKRLPLWPKNKTQKQIESDYTESLKEKITLLQNNLEDKFAKLDNSFTTRESLLNNKGFEIESQINNFAVNYQSQIDEAKQKASEVLKTEFEKYL